MTGLRWRYEDRDMVADVSERAYVRVLHYVDGWYVRGVVRTKGHCWEIVERRGPFSESKAIVEAEAVARSLEHAGEGR